MATCIHKPNSNIQLSIFVWHYSEVLSPLHTIIFRFGFLGHCSCLGALLCWPWCRVWVAGDTQRRGHDLQTVFPLRLPRTHLRLVHKGHDLPPTMSWWCDCPLPPAWMVLHSNTWWGRWGWLLHLYFTLWSACWFALCLQADTPAYFSWH